MFVYSIPMKFRYSTGNANYSIYKSELERAKDLFNERAEKMKKARKITDIQYASDGFVIILESKDELVNPSKSLAVFSQELAKMDTLADLKDSQNHLLCNNGVAAEIERDDSAFDDSTSEMLKTIIDIFMGANVADSAFVTLGRREAQKKIIDVCKEFKSLK
jgi:hypothetical protein